jgi:uncharacterized protein YbjT (DUF2867 family)
MILVVGATGTNGRAVVSRLVAAGAEVRALVRDPVKAADLLGPRVGLVPGDLDQPGALDRALAGVARAFFVAAVDERYTAWFDHFLAAARRAGTPHVVKFSGMGSATDSPSELMRQHGATDAALAASGLPFTILQPNAFYQNLLWSAATIKDHGAFYLPVGDARQSLVDVRDIAAVAAAVLTGPGREHEGRTYEITGPESLSYRDVAGRLSTVLAKPVRYVGVPPEAALASMLEAGMPEWNARAVTELYGVFAIDLFARTTDVVERITGTKPIGFDEFARDHSGAFR